METMKVIASTCWNLWRRTLTLRKINIIIFLAVCFGFYIIFKPSLRKKKQSRNTHRWNFSPSLFLIWKVRSTLIYSEYDCSVLIHWVVSHCFACVMYPRRRAWYDKQRDVIQPTRSTQRTSIPFIIYIDKEDKTYFHKFSKATNKYI